MNLVILRPARPRSSRRSSLWAAAALCLLTAGSTFAIDQSFPAAGRCEWPSSLQLHMRAAADHPVGYDTEGTYICSGVYVGNEIVLTAAHCVAYMETVDISFGEHANSPSYTLTDADCVTHPDGDWVESGPFSTWNYRGKDIAYCKLMPSSPKPPYAPVMVLNGCEVDYLRDQLFGPGSSPFGEIATIVASGKEGPDPGDPSGTKRVGEAHLLFEENSSIAQGMALRLLQANFGQDYTVRGGDSGGPILYEMPNGTWRVIGLNSKTSDYPKDLDGMGEVWYNSIIGTSVPRHVAWVESHSGRDITPCQDRIGGVWQWAADPGCGIEFDTSPETAFTDWPGCMSSVLGEVSACAGWMPPGPGGFTPTPTEGDNLVDFVLLGPDAQPVHPGFGGILAQEQVFGTGGDDTITASFSKGEEIFGGRGSDTLYGSPSGDSLHGGGGNDRIAGNQGGDTLIPGRGRDTTLGGEGDDVIVIQGSCELEPGEVIDGGAGNDKLLSPLPLEKLEALGVTVRNVEQIILNHPDVEDATCNPEGSMGPALLTRSTRSTR